MDVEEVWALPVGFQFALCDEVLSDSTNGGRSNCSGFNSPFAMRSYRTALISSDSRKFGFQFALCDEVLSDLIDEAIEQVDSCFNSPFAMRSYRTWQGDHQSARTAFQFALCDEVLSDDTDNNGTCYNCGVSIRPLR